MATTHHPNPNPTQPEPHHTQESGQRLVEATKDAHLNAGVVAALVLSILFPLAYEEKEALSRLSELEVRGGAIGRRRRKRFPAFSSWRCGELP